MKKIEEYLKKVMKDLTWVYHKAKLDSGELECRHDSG